MPTVWDDTDEFVASLNSPKRDRGKRGKGSSRAGNSGDETLEQFPAPERFTEPLDQESDVRAARKWVWQHLGWPASMLKPEMCPNSPTWRLMLRAREDEGWFIEKVYHGMKPAKSEADPGEDGYDERELADAGVEEMISAYEAFLADSGTAEPQEQEA